MADDLDELLKHIMLDVIKPEVRTEFVGHCIRAIKQTETMRKGLPKVIESLEVLNENFKTPENLEKTIRDTLTEHHEGDLWNPEVSERIDKTSKGLAKDLNSIMGGARTLISALRAVAKTQISIARTIQTLCICNLVHLLGGSLAEDAMQAALKLGAGDEAIKEYTKQKFPNE